MGTTHWDNPRDFLTQTNQNSPDAHETFLLSPPAHMRLEYRYPLLPNTLTLTILLELYSSYRRCHVELNGRQRCGDLIFPVGIHSSILNHSLLLPSSFVNSHPLSQRDLQLPSSDSQMTVNGIPRKFEMMSRGSST